MKMEAPGGVAPPGLPRLAGEALLLGQGASERPQYERIPTGCQDSMHRFSYKP